MEVKKLWRKKKKEKRFSGREFEFGKVAAETLTRSKIRDYCGKRDHVITAWRYHFKRIQVTLILNGLFALQTQLVKYGS